MAHEIDDRPTREMRPTEVRSLLRGPDAVNLEVELDVEGAPAHAIAPPVPIAAGSGHALAAPRARIAMRALTSRTLRYPRAPGGPPIVVRVLAIVVALLGAYVVGQLL